MTAKAIHEAPAPKDVSQLKITFGVIEILLQVLTQPINNSGSTLQTASEED